VKVARMEGKPQYRNVIKRLSLKSSTHLQYVYPMMLSPKVFTINSPPYAKMDDILYDKPRQLLRSLRKAIGLPASGDVAALGTMIQELQCKAETILGTKIPSIPIVAVTPSLIALYEEDLVDAFEYASLQLFKIYMSGIYVHETSAAYAGYDLGLCSGYTNPGTCKSEIHNMPMEDVLSILYTRSGLRVIYTTVLSAYWFSSLGIRFYADWNLGLDARNEEDYWKRVSDTIQQGRREWPGFAPPPKVLLLGDSTGDPIFRGVLEEIVQGWGNTSEIFGDDSEFVATKGAAELAKRSVYVISGGVPASGDGKEQGDMELR
jgi:hypothetical protein